ncbi:MAG: hypothetical protein NZM02_00865 [Patescibacteria group bacterium]|nr:hypothetical protein [Patescibacteria group bacterium]
MKFFNFFKKEKKRKKEISKEELLYRKKILEEKKINLINSGFEYYHPEVLKLDEQILELKYKLLWISLKEEFKK